MILRTVLASLAALVLLFLVLHTIIRIIRHFYKFPIPEFAANIIDNPLRRRIQPPDEMPTRHDIQAGMTVLEVGPGNGTYTVAAAKAIGESGQLITIDIEPKMIQRVKKRIQMEGIHNIDPRVADVFDLPFDNGFFDLVYMIAVIGEIPTPERAFKEFHRVLKAGGNLVFSELLMDPDYPRVKKLIDLAETSGFTLRNKVGNLAAYTVVFERSE